jgi:hypothetical protein
MADRLKRVQDLLSWISSSRDEVPKAHRGRCASSKQQERGRFRDSADGKVLNHETQRQRQTRHSDRVGRDGRLRYVEYHSEENWRVEDSKRRCAWRCRADAFVRLVANSQCGKPLYKSSTACHSYVAMAGRSEASIGLDEECSGSP